MSAEAMRAPPERRGRPAARSVSVVADPRDAPKGLGGKWRGEDHPVWPRCRRRISSPNCAVGRNFWLAASCESCCTALRPSRQRSPRPLQFRASTSRSFCKKKPRLHGPGLVVESKVVPFYSRRQLTAAHESGHATVAVGMIVEFTTIQPTSEIYGRVQTDSVTPPKAARRSRSY